MQEQDKVDSLQDVITTPFKDLENFTQWLLTKGSEVGWSLVSALLTLIIGFWVTGKLVKLIEKEWLHEMSIYQFVRF